MSVEFRKFVSQIEKMVKLLDIRKKDPKWDNESFLTLYDIPDEDCITVRSEDYECTLTTSGTFQAIEIILSVLDGKEYNRKDHIELLLHNNIGNDIHKIRTFVDDAVKWLS